MPKVFLETARIRLREFTLDDVDRIVELDSDPEVMRFISYGSPTPRTTIAEKVLPSWLAYYKRNERIGFWAAALKTTGGFVGWFHLRPDRFVAGEQEIGYRFRRDAWGFGYATEGSMALLRDGFAISKFPKITARTLLGNIASQRVMQKCGLTLEENFVYPEHILRGGTEDARRAVKYSALRDEWLDRSRHNGAF
jgi:RimJ/RimL family protein N-acetyltransferase